jgi:hypothetical protein
MGMQTKQDTAAKTSTAAKSDVEPAQAPIPMGPSLLKQQMAKQSQPGPASQAAAAKKKDAEEAQAKEKQAEGKQAKQKQSTARRPRDAASGMATGKRMHKPT